MTVIGEYDGTAAIARQLPRRPHHCEWRPRRMTTSSSKTATATASITATPEWPSARPYSIASPTISTAAVNIKLRFTDASVTDCGGIE